MRAVRKALDLMLSILAGGSLAVMVLLTCWQVVTRYVFGNPSTWSEELTAYLFAWSTLFGASVVSGERGHMSIPVFVDRFGKRGRKCFHVFSEIVALLFSAAILVYGGVQITELAMGQTTSSLGVAVGVFYTVLPICGGIIVIYSVLNIIDIIRLTDNGAHTERAPIIEKAESDAEREEA